MDIPPRARWQLAALGNPADLRDDLRRLCDFGHWVTVRAAVIGVPPSGAAFATYAGRPLARERTLAKVRANFILTCAPHRRGTVARGAIPRQHQHKVIRDVGAIADVEAGIRIRLYTVLTWRPAAKWNDLPSCNRLFLNRPLQSVKVVRLFCPSVAVRKLPIDKALFCVVDRSPRREGVDLARDSVYVAARNQVFGLTLLTRSRHFGLRLK